MKCFNCQNEINEGERFCGNCGAPVTAPPGTEVEPAPQAPAPEPPPAQPAEQTAPVAPAYDYSRKRKKLSGVAWMLIIVGAVVLAAIIAAVVIVVTSFSGGSDIDLPSIYDNLYEAPSYDLAPEYSGGINTEVTEVDGNRVIELTEEEYDAIDRIEVTAYAEYEGDLVHLGRDTTYNWDDYGNIIVDWDEAWLSVDGHLITIFIQQEVYDEENDYWTTYGYIPFQYNEGAIMEMVVCWDANDPDGYIMGYRERNSEELDDLLQFHDSNLITFVNGICDTDFIPTDSYVVSETVSYGELAGDVYYVDISDLNVFYYYTITDIYGEQYETETLYYRADQLEYTPWYKK